MSVSGQRAGNVIPEVVHPQETTMSADEGQRRLGTPADWVSNLRKAAIIAEKFAGIIRVVADGIQEMDDRVKTIDVTMDHEETQNVGE